MKLNSSPVLGLICMTSIFAMDTKLDCKDVAVSGLLDAMWFSASVATTQSMIDAAAAENQAQQGEPGAPGTPGINCWDLNGDGINDLGEDVNGDGVWDVLDCQGLDGQSTQGAPGAPGADGADGSNGVNGQDGADGNDGVDGNDGTDGADLTGVVARGVIPGADVPDPNDPGGADWIPADKTMVGIERVYRPASGSSVPSRGRFRVIVELPDRTADYMAEEITVLVSIEAVHTDGGPPGSGGTTAQAFGFWEIVEIDNVAGTLELEVMVRSAPLNFYIDATFSIVVLIP